MIPKIIHYCWYGGESIPFENQYIINSWGNHCGDFAFKLWNESNSYMDHPYMKKAYELKNWANMSNFMRLYAIYNYGGIYLDTDFKIIKNLSTLLGNKCFMGIENSSRNKVFVNNACMGAERFNPVIKDLLDIFVESFDGTEDANYSSPHLVTNYLKDNGLKENKLQFIKDVTIYPHDYFYSLPHKEKDNCYLDYITNNSYAVHLWHESWIKK